MAEFLPSSQESDIIPSDIKDFITAEYEEMIQTVQVEEPYVEQHSTVDLQPLLQTEDQQTFTLAQLENTSFMLVEPLPYMQSPTCAMLTTDEYPGPYGFEIQVNGRSSGKNWVYSYDLNKLFINMNTPIHLSFKCDFFPNGHYVRALPVYCESEAFQEAVLRCLHHRSRKDPDNEGFGEEVVHHILRIDHSQALYDYNEQSGRRSVRVALDHPQAGTDWVAIAFKFMCKNSCISGMNRRPIEVIFTLEDSSQNVVGRRTMKVRICSCPKRDKVKEEEDQKTKSGSVVPRGKRGAAPKPKADNPPAKLKKVEGFIQIPVLSIEDLVDVTDYARSRLLRRLRIEQRQPTEKEEVLLQKYKQDLNTYE